MPVAAVLMLLATGCAWQRIPVAPEFTPATSIPLRMGVVLDNTPLSASYGPGIADYWRQTKLFDEVVYPYHDGDSVDGTLSLALSGGWVGSEGKAVILVGLTLGIAGPMAGPSMTATDDVRVVFFQGTNEVARYTARAASTVSWGLDADRNQVMKKADALQTQSLAVEMARELEAHRAEILKAFGK